MTLSTAFHDSYGAEWRDNPPAVDHYGRPEREHLAVRQGVGVIDHHFDILRIRGDDRVSYVDNVVSNRIDATSGTGSYAFLLDPDGTVRFDLVVCTAAEELILFVPPGIGSPLADEWREKVFIQDVEIDVVSDMYSCIGMYGPDATEQLWHMTTIDTRLETPWAFSQTSLTDHGITVINTDRPVGEPGYWLVCEQSAAEPVIETLITGGVQAIPFGFLTWEALTLEAGTPIYPADIEGEIPNSLGIRAALDFEKGCFIGQEVVSRIENRGRPPQRLIGLLPDTHPAAGDPISDGTNDIGHITRTAYSATREAPIAFGLVSYSCTAESVSITSNSSEIPATVHSLPFVDGSERSARLPVYPDEESD